MTIKELELKIVGKIGAIRRKELMPKDSGIGKLLNELQLKDEVAYEMYLKQYKQIYKNLYQ